MTLKKSMNTTIVDLPCIMNEFGQTDAISVLADLICIIMHMPNGWVLSAMV